MKENDKVGEEWRKGVLANGVGGVEDTSIVSD